MEAACKFFLRLEVVGSIVQRLSLKTLNHFSFNLDELKCKSRDELPSTNISHVINHPYDCPVPPPKAFPYTDDFGRNRAFLFSAASNPNNPEAIQKCLNKADAKFHSKFLVPCDEKNVSPRGIGHESDAIF